MSITQRAFTTRGTGAPDYQKIVHKGAVAQRIVLDADEILFMIGLLADDIPSPYAHARGALAAGEVAPAVDIFTGLSNYVIPVGYSADIYFYWWSWERPIKGYQYADTFLVTTLHDSPYNAHYENEIGSVGIPSDPTGLAAHIMRYTLENRGDDESEGYFMAMGKLFPVGTPPLPDTKDVKCKDCGHITKGVDRKATRNRCPECGFTTFYYPILLGGESRLPPIKEDVLNGD